MNVATRGRHDTACLRRGSESPRYAWPWMRQASSRSYTRTDVPKWL